MEQPQTENVSRHQVPTQVESTNPDDLAQDSWNQFYLDCPYWCETWVATKEPQSRVWPKGIQVFREKCSWMADFASPVHCKISGYASNIQWLDTLVGIEFVTQLKFELLWQTSLQRQNSQKTS